MLLNVDSDFNAINMNHDAEAVIMELRCTFPDGRVDAEEKCSGCNSMFCSGHLHKMDHRCETHEDNQQAELDNMVISPSDGEDELQE